MERRHLWVDIWVDADQHARGLASGLRRCGDVVQVKFGVHVDQHALLHGQAQLPGQLAIAVEDGPAVGYRVQGLAAKSGHARGSSSGATPLLHGQVQLSGQLTKIKLNVQRCHFSISRTQHWGPLWQQHIMVRTLERHKQHMPSCYKQLEDKLGPGERAW